jgi:hypothetical protein
MLLGITVFKGRLCVTKQVLFFTPDFGMEKRRGREGKRREREREREEVCRKVELRGIGGKEL